MLMSVNLIVIGVPSYSLEARVAKRRDRSPRSSRKSTGPPLCGEKTARWVLRVTRGDAGITGDISTRTRLGALGRGIIRQIHVTQDGLSEFPRSA